MKTTLTPPPQLAEIERIVAQIESKKRRLLALIARAESPESREALERIARS